jgi:CRISPR-associated protein Cas1
MPSRFLMRISTPRNIVAGKIQNTRSVVLRGAREADNQEDEEILRETAGKLANCLQRLSVCKDPDSIRGIEGEGGRAYFESFDRMIKVDRETFRFVRRSRRPPLDPINALLSFLYTLLLNDCVAGAEGVGLDPQIGFLHAVRPGRPALALDLIEELRAILADRIALTLINRRQITEKDFEVRPGGSVYLNEKGRKEVVVAYQKRKQEEVIHPLIKSKIPFGLISHTQARILARFLRQDIEEYLPFLYR